MRWIKYFVGAQPWPRPSFAYVFPLGDGNRLLLRVGGPNALHHVRVELWYGPVHGLGSPGPLSQLLASKRVVYSADATETVLLHAITEALNDAARDIRAFVSDDPDLESLLMEMIL